jgi:signal transduction histidine kinase
MPKPAKPGRFAWRNRLYLRIYLAVLGSVVAAAVIFGWLAHQYGGQPPIGPHLDTFAELMVTVMPPASSTPAEQQKALQKLHVLVHSDLSLFDANGKIIANIGPAITPPQSWQAGQTSSNWYSAHPPIFALRLPDGRWLLGQRKHPPRRPPNALFNIFLVAAIGIALGAYPVVRRLTRRLERLQTSVDTWGQGKLATRVEVEGEDEVGRLAHSFNQAGERIEALVQAQKSLLANASHELRSPLARIRMALELLPADQNLDVQNELTRNIHELDQIIDEILLSSRLDATNQQDATLETIDCIGLLAEECARVDAEMEIDWGQTPSAQQGNIETLAEAKLVRRMLRNLLENARRHGAAKTGDGGDNGILAIIRQKNGQIEFDICDRGPGVPEAEREHIFAPFFRLSGAREADGGVGLGLALVRQIAQRHSGSVACLAREGGGSCFRLRLPVRP